MFKVAISAGEDSSFLVIIAVIPTFVSGPLFCNALRRQSLAHRYHRCEVHGSPEAQPEGRKATWVASQSIN
jgi:hypothetical protein